MNMIKLSTIAIAAMALTAAGSMAHAATANDANLPEGVYYGTSNPNGHWTISSDSELDASVALGVTYRYLGPVAPTPANSANYNVQAGYYTAPTGTCQGICSLWNFQFSVNWGGGFEMAGSDSWLLSINKASNGQTIAFDPTLIGDNASNGHGFQNSENIAYFGFLNSSFNFDPAAADTYTITLSLVNGDSTPILSVSEIVNAQAAPSATPIPAALPLFASGLGAFGFIAHRRRKKKLAA